MAKHRVALVLRRPRNQRRLNFPVRRFSYCPTNPAANPLIHLQAFSNTRENQWFSRSTGLPRIEFSPMLQLIRSSEGLDKNAPQQGKSKHAPNGSTGALRSNTPMARSTSVSRRRSLAAHNTTGSKHMRMMGLRLRSADRIALNIGQVVLARHEKERRELLRQISRLEKAAKVNDKALKAIEKSHRRVTAKYLQLLGKDKTKNARKGIRDLVLIALGVTSVSILCLLWSKNVRINKEVRRILSQGQEQQRHNIAVASPATAPVVNASEPGPGVIQDNRIPPSSEAITVAQIEPIPSQKGLRLARLFWT